AVPRVHQRLRSASTAESAASQSTLGSVAHSSRSCASIITLFNRQAYADWTGASFAAQLARFDPAVA
ncbi:MAG: hypothetical protein ACFCUG_08175, partial [Thiotrichales bacterium]